MQVLGRAQASASGAAGEPRRAFRRITGAALDAVLPKAEAEAEPKEADKAKDEDKAEGADD